MRLRDARRCATRPRRRPASGPARSRDDLGRGHRPLRHRQARPALRHGARSTSRAVFAGTEVKAFAAPCRQGDAASRAARRSARSRLDGLVERAKALGRQGPGLVPGDVGDPPALDSPARRSSSADAERAGHRDRGRRRRGRRPGADRRRRARAGPARCSARCASTSAAAGDRGRAAPLLLGHRLPAVRGRRRGRATPWPPTTPSRCRTPRTSTCSRPTRWRVRSQAYDLVLNGWELGSGSIRIHRRGHPAAGLRRPRHHGRGGRDAASGSCSAPSGTAPRRTAGFAVGLDRLVAIFAGEENIREVIAFPKTQSGTDPMTGGAQGGAADACCATCGLRPAPRPG